MKDIIFLIAGVGIVIVAVLTFRNGFSLNSNSDNLVLEVTDGGMTCNLSGSVTGVGVATKVITSAGQPILTCQGTVVKPGSEGDAKAVVDCGNFGRGNLALAPGGGFTVTCQK